MSSLLGGAERFELGSRHRPFDQRFGAAGAPGGSGAGDATPQELVEKYPPGSAVTVYYDPNHPAHAVLEPRNMRNATVAIVATVAFGFSVLPSLPPRCAERRGVLVLCLRQ